MLTRDNSHAAAVFDALSDREIPVEIVGLKGLLRLPEVSEVVATLTLVQDVTANAALLTLLAGPRWAIGPRDLALLGRRARELAGAQAGRPGVRRRRGPAAGRGRGRRPDRDRVAVRRARGPGRPRLLRRGARPVRAARRRAAPAARRRRRADPRPGPPDHRHDRHRRRAGLVGQPGGRGPTRQPRPVRAGGGRVPGRRRRRSRWPRCWPGWRPRTSSGRASTSRPRRRPTRSSCSPSTAPRASSGTSCSWSASPSASSPPTAAGPAGSPCRR